MSVSTCIFLLNMRADGLKTQSIMTYEFTYNT